MILYHGSKEVVKYPEIRKARFHKDFYFGFYCTQFPEQARRWAGRYGTKGYLNQYEYTPNEKLKYLRFDEMTEEWLDLSCSAERALHILMILWKVRWQMIRFIIISRISLTEKYPEPHSGNWRNLTILPIRSAFIRFRRWIR